MLSEKDALPFQWNSKVWRGNDERHQMLLQQMGSGCMLCLSNPYTCPAVDHILRWSEQSCSDPSCSPSASRVLSVTGVQLIQSHCGAVTACRQG